MKTDVVSEAFTGSKEVEAEEIPVVKFTKVDGYTTFEAEWAVDDGHLVFHFFLPPELKGKNTKEVRQFWETTFPQQLVGAALRSFKEPGRLKFDYVGDYELDSWWFKAFGFGSLLDPKALCAKFFDQLDSDIEEATKNT